MFSFHKDNELVLILDVQSSIIRGALVHITKDSKPSIIFTHNVIIPYKPHARSGYLVKMALRGISETIDTLQRNLHLRIHEPENNIPKKISRVQFVLSSPWIASQAKTVSLSFDKENLINKKNIMELISSKRTKL